MQALGILLLILVILGSASGILALAVTYSMQKRLIEVYELLWKVLTRSSEEE